MTTINSPVPDAVAALRYAESLFQAKDYTEAVRVLQPVVTAEASHARTDARLLLARAYYHSAQLSAAEQLTRELIDENPTNSYAVLLLARTLQRQSRHREAAGYVAMAKVWGLLEQS